MKRIFKRHDDTMRTILESRHNLRYTLALEGAFVGLVAGLVAVAYRWAMLGSAELHKFILEFAGTSPWLVPAFFTFLLMLALAVGALMHWEPAIVGSGIPDVEGELKGYLDMPWWRVIIGKLTASVLCIIGGLSLGREGPSVQLGAAAGKGYSKVFGRSNLEERYLITCGASAGLSAAFNCPMAGVMFALEEIHKDYSITILFSAMTASVVADFVSKLFFGMKPVFHIPVAEILPLSYYWLLIILGVILGFAGAAFNIAMDKTGDFYSRLNYLPANLRPVIPFLLAGVLGFFLPDVLGDGHIMLNELSAGGLTFELICLLLLVKFAYSMICFSSGAPGGSLAPMLVIGAYVGGFCGHVAILAFGIDSVYLNNFVILAMAGFFASVVRAPLTAIILISELTGSLDHTISLSLVVVLSEITARAVHSTPVYDLLLEKQLRRTGRPMVTDEQEEAKTLVTMTIGAESTLDGSRVSEILWPESSLVVSVTREGHEFIPHGGTILCKGDRISLISNVQYLAEVKNVLATLCEEKVYKEMKKTEDHE